MCNSHVRKTRFKCDFYHLSNRCVPNVMKINVKINTMQNTNVLLFVRSLLKECLIAVWSHFWQVIIDTAVMTSEENVSRHVSVQMVDILNTICEQTLADNLHFHVFVVQVASIHRVSFLLCWCLMVDRPSILNCKALSLLRTVNEQRAKCWYFAWC